MRRKMSYDPARDYYLILGIDASATAEAVRRAYRQRVRDVHPDLNPERAEWATEQLKLVNEAYDVLGNAVKRRDYDRLRWPHVPHRQRYQHTTSQHRRSTVPPYDPDRPWWEQAAERTPHGYPFSASSATEPGRRAGPATAPRPGWMIISDWLKARGLTTLDRTWITLVGLWRSPYAPVLSLLAIVLALNVASIIYIAMNPNVVDDLPGWASGPGAAPTVPPPPATITPTRDLLVQACTDPGAQITIPVSGDVVGDQFSVYGTVDVPELWAYEIAIGYSGMVRTASEPDNWRTVRAAPRNQSVAERPVADGPLTEDPIDLSGQPEGYYAIRLRLILQDGDIREPCDVIVLH